MKVRRTKPYVCVDVDYADHSRFQATTDLDAAAGTWLRCLAHTRAQEQDGVVTQAWVHRTFPETHHRIDELVAVGLLARREDGDYELHAYAPRNQTSAMIAAERKATRTRVRKWRKEVANLQSAQAAQNDAFPSTDVTSMKRVTEPEVTPNQAPPVTEVKRVTNAFVPTSTSSYFSSLVSSASSSQPDPLTLKSVPRADAHAHARDPLPRSERGMSGSLWLTAFSEGITAHTGRPCSMGRMYVSTLERLVTHHAPERDPSKACVWLHEQAQAFAALWDGQHPPKGLTPDGLERWLNEGRPAPPVFGKPRIVQLPADQWHEDDWSDFGAEVLR